MSVSFENALVREQVRQQRQREGGQHTQLSEQMALSTPFPIGFSTPSPIGMGSFMSPPPTTIGEVFASIAAINDYEDDNAEPL